MKVERQNEEILVRLSAGMRTTKIQAILDYLRYEELTSKSEPKEEGAASLIEDAKKGRWERTKTRLDEGARTDSVLLDF